MKGVMSFLLHARTHSRARVNSVSHQVLDISLGYVMGYNSKGVMSEVVIVTIM